MLAFLQRPGDAYSDTRLELSDEPEHHRQTRQQGECRRRPLEREVEQALRDGCDVFLTNKLPRVRKKLKIDVDDIRAHNPNMIYVRGTGNGERGPEADRGGDDGCSFWARAVAARRSRGRRAETARTGR